MNDPTNNDVMEQTIQAAKDAGRVVQKPSLKFLRPASQSSRRWPGRQSFATRKTVPIPLATAIAELRRNPTIKGLFERARAWTCAATTPHFRAIRKRNPELLGLA